MSLVNAVHALLEVAAGRRNLSAAEVDELHHDIDAEQNEGHALTVQPAPVPVPSSPAGDSPAKGVNLDAPADA